MSAIVLGLLNIVIYVVLLMFVGVLVDVVLRRFVFDVGDRSRRLYIALIALIAIYMLIALLFGLPMARPFWYR